MKLRFICVWLVVCVLAGILRAGEVLPYLVIDGVTYQDVRWGPVNQGKITFLHSRGAATVPLEKLPKAYQQKFGYDAEKAAQEAQAQLSKLETQGDSAYARMKREQARQQLEAAMAKQQVDATERSKHAVIEGKFVDRTQLTELVGILSAKAEFTEDDQVTRGYMLDLARLKDSARNVPKQYQMRPGLWEKTGHQVFLRDYTTDTLLGALVRLYGQQVEDTQIYRTYLIAREPTREEMSRLQR